MKCLSLWQPWASLMAVGAKTIEARSWATSHRGWLAIHAAKTWNADVRSALTVGAVRAALARDARYHSTLPNAGLPMGKIVCVVWVSDCKRVEDMFGPMPGGDEWMFGDYSPGRFGWITDPERLVPIPGIPCVGRQGIFELPTSINDELARLGCRG